MAVRLDEIIDTIQPNRQGPIRLDQLEGREINSAPRPPETSSQPVVVRLDQLSSQAEQGSSRPKASNLGNGTLLGGGRKLLFKPQPSQGLSLNLFYLINLQILFDSSLVFPSFPG